MLTLRGVQAITLPMGANKKYFLGYQNNVPIKKNQIVTIKKGTPIDIFTQKGKTASKTYKVKVHHVLCGRSFFVGYYHNGEFHESWMSSNDKEWVQELYGTTDLTRLWPLLTVWPNGNVFIHIDSPKVVWVGAGGYWHEVDINLIPEAQVE